MNNVRMLYKSSYFKAEVVCRVNNGVSAVMCCYDQGRMTELLRLMHQVHVSFIVFLLWNIKNITMQYWSADPDGFPFLPAAWNQFFWFWMKLHFLSHAALCWREPQWGWSSVSTCSFITCNGLYWRKRVRHLRPPQVFYIISFMLLFILQVLTNE